MKTLQFLLSMENNILLGFDLIGSFSKLVVYTPAEKYYLGSHPHMFKHVNLCIISNIFDLKHHL